jgi:hypothetical protein
MTSTQQQAQEGGGRAPGPRTDRTPVETFRLAVPRTLAVRTSIPRLTWPWGSAMPEVGQDDYDAATVRVRVAVDRGSIDLRAHREAHSQSFHRFSGTHHGRSVQLERRIPGVGPLRLEVSGVLDQEIAVTANLRYASLVRYRAMGLHSLGYVVGDLVETRLLHEGLVPLYGAAIRHPDWGVVLILGSSMTGKTVTAFRACREHGAELIAEDRVILSGAGLLAVPWTTSSLRAGQRAGRSRQDPVPVAAGDIGTVDHVVVLEKSGTHDRSALGRTEAERRIGILSRTVSQYHVSPAVLAYAYFNSELDIARLMATEVDGWRTVIDRAAGIHALSGPDPWDFAPRMAAILGGRG